MILILNHRHKGASMPDKQPMYLTAEGAAKLEAELKDLKGPQRLAISRRLRDAIQMGDLSENADYHKAKEDQGFLEGRIQELEFMFRNAIIVEPTSGPKDIVSVGVHVTVQEDRLRSGDLPHGWCKGSRPTCREDLARIPHWPGTYGSSRRRYDRGDNSRRKDQIEDLEDRMKRIGRPRRTAQFI